MSGRSQGKTAPVTGGARRPGAAIVELSAEKGASVVFGDVRGEQGQARH